MVPICALGATVKGVVLCWAGVAQWASPARFADTGTSCLGSHGDRVVTTGLAGGTSFSAVGVTFETILACSAVGACVESCRAGLTRASSPGVSTCAATTARLVAPDGVSVEAAVARNTVLYAAGIVTVAISTHRTVFGAVEVGATFVALIALPLSTAGARASSLLVARDTGSMSTAI